MPLIPSHIKYSFHLAAVLLCTVANNIAMAADGNGGKRRFTHIEGTVFHTTYNILYDDTIDHSRDFEQLFRDIDGSLSMFNDTSILSRINRGDEKVVVNAHVRTVINKAAEVSKVTQGAFDITVAPLVNLWGFGFRYGDSVTPENVDSILQFVGYQGIRIDKKGVLHKKDPRMMIDLSSIAKGYACDVVADWLKEKGIANYMVEIGGEISVQGTNEKGKPWSIGINTPAEDSLATNRELQEVVRVTHGGIATSGNYRNFYYKDGQRYAHTINPHTGYPVQQDVLSATVFAPDCMTADAYATAFMVMGSEEALKIAKATPSIKVYLILSPTAGSSQYRTVCSPSL